jgi:hypothetical protein
MCCGHVGEGSPGAAGIVALLGKVVLHFSESFKLD